MPRNTCTPSFSMPSIFPLRVAAIVMSGAGYEPVVRVAEVGLALLEERGERLEVGGLRRPCGRTRRLPGRGRRAPRRSGPRARGASSPRATLTGILAMRRASSIVSGISCVGLDRTQREAALDRFVGGDPVAGVELRARRAGRPSRPASAGCPRLREPRRAERTARATARRRRDEHEVDVQQHRQADADAEPVDRGDQRLLERGERVEEAREAGPGIADVVRAPSVLDARPISPRS